MTGTRRNFIKKITIASTGLLPVTKAISAALTPNEQEWENKLEDSFKESLEFHLIDNNLLNLHFYFINTTLKRHYLSPDDYTAPSFMVVRLPQMHVSERGFFDSDWDSTPPPLPAAILSGYSYLAFELWPTPNRNESKQQRRERRSKFSLDNILNWNDQRSYNLITLVEWFDLKHADNYNLNPVYDLQTFKQKKVWNKAKKIQEKYYVTSEPQSIDFKQYKSIVSTLLDGNLTETQNQACFVPITFFEVPQGAILVPISRDTNGNLSPAQKRFWPNKTVNQRRTDAGIRKYEVHNNTLFYNKKAVQSDGDASAGFDIQTPSFRIMGIIAKESDLKLFGNIDICTIDCSKDIAKNILPSLLDKTELALLTQWANDEANAVKANAVDHRQIDFDIQELNGFFFTGLGVITHLKYYNVEKKPDNVDLIEYEHIITQGRDIFMKVSRLGYNSKTGQRYKHVIEGRRKIKTADETGKPGPSASFIELKQYCECIDFTVDYLSERDTWNPTDFQQINLNLNAGNLLDNLLMPVTTATCHYRRNPYSSLRVVEKKRIPIDCLQDVVLKPDVCTLESTLWFWPVKESAKLTGKRSEDINLNDYLTCEFTGHDHEKQQIPAETPFMFIRATLLKCSSPAKIQEMLSNYFSNSHQNHVDRRKTYYGNQKIAFTPSLKPKQTASAMLNGPIEDDSDSSKSKTNILETEFVETYFSIRKIPNTNLIGQVKYVICPQVLRMKVFIDHVKDLTQQRIPSVLEYHEDYIKSGFEEYSRNATDVVGNGAKMILKNTVAFMSKAEEPFNNTYDQITAAIQQAKDKLGNLVVPDIVPDTISLEKLGITAPPKIKCAIQRGRAVLGDAVNGIQKIAQFNPRELLRGKLSNVCGLDLSSILDDLLPAGDAKNETPLFQINKLLNKVQGEVTGSPVYKAITDFKIKDPIDGEELSPNDLVAKYDTKITKLKTDIETERTNLNNEIKTLAETIPNADQLNNLAKSLFEKYRTEAFNIVLASTAFEDVAQSIKTAGDNVKTFFDTEQRLLDEEYDTIQAAILDPFSKLTDEVNALPAELQQLAGAALSAYIQTKLLALYRDTKANLQTKLNNLFDLVPDATPAKAGADAIYYVPAQAGGTAPTTWELTNDHNIGKPLLIFDPIVLVPDATNLPKVKYLQLQKKVEDLKTFVIKNLNGNPFQQKAAMALQATLRDYNTAFATIQKEVEQFEQPLTPGGSFATLMGNISLWLNRAANYTSTQGALSLETANAISKVQEAVTKVGPFVAYLRRYDPYFYLTQQQSLIKEITDIQRRFFSALVEIFGTPADIQNPDCDLQKPLSTILNEIGCCLKSYNDLINKLKVYLNDKLDPANHTLLSQYVKDFKDQITRRISSLGQRALLKLTTSDAYKEAKDLYDKIAAGNTAVAAAQADLDNYTKHYNDILQQAQQITGNLDRQVNAFISQKQAALIQEVGADKIAEIQAEINEAKDIYNLITSIKQQDITYDWSTSGFKDVNLGIVSFKTYNDPPTSLSVAVKVSILFSQGKFPPVIDKIITRSENRFTNFGVNFFSCITVGFSEVSFIAGSDQSTHFDVKIKSVQFDGALSFVQAFEKWLQTLGTGLILQLENDHVALGYSLPIPSITSPAFSFFNLSLNFDLRLYFDSRPLLFGFSLATADRKFGISAFIYAGFGFFAIVVSPKRGIVGIDCALEAGAWAGISIGPISGEVKLAFGFRYTKNDFGVRIEGYIVAEGRLSVWILEVSARIYLGIVSDNGVVEGECIVSYSVKLGFVSKSFSGSFRKKIAGSESNNQQGAATNVSENTRAFTKMLVLRTPAGPDQVSLLKAHASFFDRSFPAYLQSVPDNEAEETYAVSEDEWYQFINAY